MRKREPHSEVHTIKLGNFCHCLEYILKEIHLRGEMSRVKRHIIRKKRSIPRVAMIAAKTTMPTGCKWFVPIGYLYLFWCCIVHFVNQRMDPASRSSIESSAEATIDSEPLLTAARTCQKGGCTWIIYSSEWILHDIGEYFLFKLG